MSSVNGNGKGTIVMSFLYPTLKVTEQIDLEFKLKNELAKVLYQNDIKKFIIASDSDKLTNHLLIQNSEFNLELESFLNSLSESKDMKTVQNMVNDFRKSWKGE